MGYGLFLCLATLKERSEKGKKQSKTAATKQGGRVGSNSNPFFYLLKTRAWDKV